MIVIIIAYPHTLISHIISPSYINRTLFHSIFYILFPHTGVAEKDYTELKELLSGWDSKYGSTSSTVKCVGIVTIDQLHTRNMNSTEYIMGDTVYQYDPTRINKEVDRLLTIPFKSTLLFKDFSHSDSFDSVTDSDLDCSSSTAMHPSLAPLVNLQLGCSSFYCAKRDWLVGDIRNSLVSHFRLSATDLVGIPDQSIDVLYRYVHNRIE